MSLKTETYEHLQHRIVTNELKAGQQLYEKELMKEYGIGRTPLREIFQELQRKGLIEIIPKLGTRVISMDLQMLREVVQIRKVLEGLAAQMAASNISPRQLAELGEILDKAARVEGNDRDALLELSELDAQFHQIIYDASGNLQLREMIDALLLKMSMYWFQVGFSADEFSEQYEELRELYAAIEDRRADDAKNIMEKHIDHFIKLVKNNIL